VTDAQLRSPASTTALAAVGNVRLQAKMGAFVRNALDLLGRVAEQLVSKVGQGPRSRYLLPDLGDLLVIGITAGKAVAYQASAAPGQLRLGERLRVFRAE
jgi:hypothetical protein